MKTWVVWVSRCKTEHCWYPGTISGLWISLAVYTMLCLPALLFGYAPRKKLFVASCSRSWAGFGAERCWLHTLTFHSPTQRAGGHRCDPAPSEPLALMESSLWNSFCCSGKSGWARGVPGISLHWEKFSVGAEMGEEQSFAWQCLCSERIYAALLAGPQNHKSWTGWEVP